VLNFVRYGPQPLQNPYKCFIYAILSTRLKLATDRPIFYVRVTQMVSLN